MNSSVDGTEVPFRPTVLILVAYYLPGYKSGGPVRSISNFVEKLGDEFEFKIITSDRDFGDREPYNGIQPDRWMPVGKAKVLYVRNGDPATILKHMRATPHGVLYLSSFFALGFSIIPMCASAVGALRTPCVILAPHGEFSQGALGIKHKRKMAFIDFARVLRAYQRVIWHASSQYEANDVQRLFGDHLRRESPWRFWVRRSLTPRPISVITALDFASGDASGAAVSKERAVKPRGAVRAVFLSRIARMKNLATAIRTLQNVDGRVTFDVYGPVEDQVYWHECQDLIASLPANVHVRYRGPIKHEDVHGTLSSYDVFFLPTCGEAYGHVVVEALQTGCPVLISDQTPWRDLESRGVGWDLPLDQPARFREAIQRCIDMSPEDHAAMCARAKTFARERSEDPEVLAQHRALFLQAPEQAR